MRKSLIVISLCAAMCLSGCGNSITPPFSCTGYQALQCQDAVGKMEDAGFSNITVEPVPSKYENNTGLVVSVSIDGNSSFTDYLQYDASVPVVVKYYAEPEPTAVPEATPEPNAEPEAMPVDKETAITLDSALASVTAGMEEEYNSFLSSFASGDISSNLSAYNAAKSLSADLSTTCNTLLTSKTLDNDEYISYVCAVVEYGYAMQAVADDTMVYIDDGKTSSLSAVQDAIAAAQKPMLTVATTRLAFLQAAGCTADEIDDILEG